MKLNWNKLAVSVVTPLVVGYLGSLITVKEISSWYMQINKPALTPPNGVFGPVWTMLYVLMGVSLYLVWTKKSKKKKTKAMVVFGIQLVLNLLWSYLFFGKHWLLVSSLEIVILWLVILVNILSFKKHSVVAAGLLVPYLIWVSFATYLTFSVWWLN